MMLEGQTCLVTGSSRGIGRGIATDLADRGADVVVNYRSSAAEAEAVVGKIETAGGRAIAAQADVSEFDDVVDMYEEVESAFGGIDVLVNNAGISMDAAVHETTPEEWRRVQSVNVDGIYHCSRAAVPHLTESESGRIINIASQRGLLGGATDRQAAYCASKGAAVQLSRQMAIDYGPAGVTVNAICPGPIESSMNDMTAEEREAIVRDHLVTPFVGQPEDIGHVAAFLASDEARYVTGHALVVDGGYLVS